MLYLLYEYTQVDRYGLYKQSLTAVYDRISPYYVIQYYGRISSWPYTEKYGAIWAGGDVKRSEAIHKAFSLLNLPNFKDNIFNNDLDDDIRILINQLLGRTIILKSIIKGSNGE